MAGARVFVSYSHKDRTFLDELRPFLLPLERDGIVGDVWDDGDIRTGSSWLDEIRKACDGARIAILLVSQDFVASDFIDEHELPVLLKKDAVFPVYLSPCDLPEELRELQFLNGLAHPLSAMDENGRLEVWKKLAEEIRERAAAFEPPPWSPDRILEGNSVLVLSAREDRPWAEELAGILEERDWEVGLEHWGGTGTSPESELASRPQNSFIVLVGSRGFGSWDRSHLKNLVRGRDRRPVVPALLPRSEDRPSADRIQIPSFLRYYAVKLDHGLRDESTIDLLVERLAGGPAERPPAVLREAPPQVAADREQRIRKAIDALEDHVGDHLTVFLGMVPARAEDTFTPWTYDVTHELLRQLELIEPEYRELLPPLDLAGSYYAAKKDESALEAKVHEILDRRSREIYPSEDSCVVIPPAHRKLVELLRQVRFRGAHPGASGGKQLVVTTSFDLVLESALLQAGIPFTRIVQHGDGVDVNELHRIELEDGWAKVWTAGNTTGAESAAFSLDDPDELRRLLSSGERYRRLSRKGDGSKPLDEVQLDERASPWVYKFHGSKDVGGSCTITADQVFDFLEQVTAKRSIPAQIKAFMSSGLVLLSGYGFLDSTFRVIAHTLLAEPREHFGRSYAVQQSPHDGSGHHQRLRAKLSTLAATKARRSGFAVLETSADRFFEQAIERLEVSRHAS